MSTEPSNRSFTDLVRKHEQSIDIGLSILREDGELMPRLEGALATVDGDEAQRTLVLRYAVELVEDGKGNREELKQLLDLMSTSHGVEISPGDVREAREDAAGTAMLAGQTASQSPAPSKEPTVADGDDENKEIPGEDHCAQYLDKKGRYCGLSPQKGCEFCHLHPLEDDSDEVEGDDNADADVDEDGVDEDSDARPTAGIGGDENEAEASREAYGDGAQTEVVDSAAENGGGDFFEIETATGREVEAKNSLSESSGGSTNEDRSTDGHEEVASGSEVDADTEFGPEEPDLAEDGESEAGAESEVREATTTVAEDVDSSPVETPPVSEHEPDLEVDETEGEATSPIDHEQLRQDALASDDAPRPTARDRQLPDDSFPVYDRLTRQNTLAQSKLSFDYVRDDGILVDGNHYIGLVKVQPRNWLVLNDSEKNDVFSAFVSFLLQLKYPTQIICYPHEFDVSEHTNKIREADARAGGPNETPITRHGRRRHVVWCHNSVDQRNIKDRDFYIAVRVRAEHVHSYLQNQNSIGSVFQKLPTPISDRLTFIPGVRSSEEVAADEERCVSEVRNRQSDIEDTLTRTGVGTRTIKDRNETMDILYSYYNHLESPFTDYNHATYSDMLGGEIASLGGDR